MNCFENILAFWKGYILLDSFLRFNLYKVWYWFWGTDLDVVVLVFLVLIFISKFFGYICPWFHEYIGFVWEIVDQYLWMPKLLNWGIWLLYFWWVNADQYLCNILHRKIPESRNFDMIFAVSEAFFDEPGIFLLICFFYKLDIWPN